MVVLQDRKERNKLRNAVVKAEDDKVITKEEAGFIIMLTDRFRADVEKKLKQLTMLQGEIAQLQLNEKIIVELIENMVKAAERDLARQETMRKIKETRGEAEGERRREEQKDPE